MNTANLSELPEVQITDHDKTADGMVPLAPAVPDFVARAQAIWGDKPEGASLSALVDESRGPDDQGSVQKMLEILAQAPQVEPEEQDWID